MLQSIVGEHKRIEPERFGPFLLRRRLGEGGMAEVFEAGLATPGQPQGVPERVALKRVLPSLKHNAEAYEAFLTEGDVALMLRHPNLVRVYASGEEEGVGWLCMELVDGWDLETLLAARPGQPLVPALACHIVLQMLAGLGAMHAATGKSGTPLGLIHRDVTPSNVFLDREGRIKLADLGIALVSGLGEQTVPGKVKGKLRYLSPEQVVAAPLGVGTDLFAAGAILYELLSAEYAFPQDGDEAVMLAIRDGKLRPLMARRPELPVGLSKICARALHRKAKRRYQSAAEFVDALAALVYLQGWGLVQDEAAALMKERMHG